MKTLSLKLSDELETKLVSAARKQQLAKSELVRRALDVYLNNSENVQAGSFLELAEDLIGSLEGPDDLSHNRAHMKDYGR